MGRRCRSQNRDHIRKFGSNAIAALAAPGWTNAGVELSFICLTEGSSPVAALEGAASFSQ
jgi:hypothetical protein